MLYESYVHPITILSTLPSAGVGALLALLLFKTEFSVIALIGVILLIGIVKKNAIMMIDFALDAERDARPDAARRDLRGLPAALPADHDDDDGGAARRAAAGARRRRRRRAAPAARHLDRRRPDRQPAADALHDAGRLSLPRPLPPVVPRALRAARRRAGRAPRDGVTPDDDRAPDPRSRRARRALALAGCTVGPDYVRPAAPAPAAYKEAAGWKPAQPGDAAPRGDVVEGLRRSGARRARRSRSTSRTRRSRAAEASYRQARAAVRGGARRALSRRGRERGAARRARAANARGGGTASAYQRRSVGRRAGKSTCGAASAAASRRAKPARRRAPPISRTRGCRCRRELAQNYLLLRVAGRADQRCCSDTVDGYERSLQLTRNQYAAGVVARADVVQAETQLLIDAGAG